jgi:hypothetical protein
MSHIARIMVELAMGGISHLVRRLGVGSVTTHIMGEVAMLQHNIRQPGERYRRHQQQPYPKRQREDNVPPLQQIG